MFHNNKSLKSYEDKLWGFAVTSKERTSTPKREDLNFGAVVTGKKSARAVNAGLNQKRVNVYTFEVAYDLRFIELEKMKKVISLLLVLCMVFALCACGAKEEAAPAEEAAAEVPAEEAPATEEAPAEEAAAPTEE